jgi:hypothetical protein
VVYELRLKKHLNMAHGTWSIVIIEYRRLKVNDYRSSTYDISTMIDYTAGVKTRKTLSKRFKGNRSVAKVG